MFLSDIALLSTVLLCKMSSHFNSRSRSKIWLLDEYLPMKDVDSDRIVFRGAHPPTVKDVFMNFKGQHAKLQEETKRQSKVRHAAEKTLLEVKDWWLKTGIDLKSDNGLLKMILGLNDTYQTLLKHKKRSSEKEVESRKQFVDDCRQIFWPVSKKFEQKTASSCNPILEDFHWLQALKDSTRHACIGCKDIKTAKKLKRKITEKINEAERKKIKPPIEKNANLNTMVIDSEESKDE